jgi:hypothetical protein
LFAWTTFVAVIAAFFRVSVALGIIVAILGVPTAARGAVIILRRRDSSRRLTPAERNHIFISSFSYVMVCGMFFLLGSIAMGTIASVPLFLLAPTSHWSSTAIMLLVQIASLIGGGYVAYQAVRDWED